MNSGLSAMGAMMGLEDLLADLGNTNNGPVEGEEDTSGGSTDVQMGDDGAIRVSDEVEVIEGAGETATVEQTAPVVEPTKPKGKKGGKGKGKKATAPVVDAAPADTAPAADTTVETKTEETKPAEEPKKPAEPRIFWGRNKLGRLTNKLGTGIDSAFLFEVADIELEGDALTTLVAARKVEFKALAIKVQNRATNVLEFVTGKALDLNPVIVKTLRLLAKDRKLSTGDKGNLFLMLSMDYTGGSARAMGNSTMGMLKALKIVNETGKQTFEANPESTVLAVISDKLLLSFIDRDEALAIVAKDEADALAAAAANPGAVDEPQGDAPVEPVTTEETAEEVVEV